MVDLDKITITKETDFEKLSKEILEGKIKPEFGNPDHISALRYRESINAHSFIDRNTDREECEHCNGTGERIRYQCPLCYKRSECEGDLFDIEATGISVTVTCKKCKKIVYPTNQ